MTGNGAAVITDARHGGRGPARAETGYLARPRAGELTTQIYGFSRTAGED